MTHLIDSIKLQAEQTLEEAPRVIRPTCLKWYPDNMGWQLNLTRKDIRRQEIYYKLHNFLISETESGNFLDFNLSLYR